MRRLYILLSAAGLAALSACSDSPLETQCCRLLTSIEISPPTGTVAAGDSLDFSAVVRDEDDQIVNTEIAWSVSDADFGSVTTSGRFHATADGTVYVRSVVGVLRDSALVTITP